MKNKLKAWVIFNLALSTWLLECSSTVSKAELVVALANRYNAAIEPYGNSQEKGTLSAKNNTCLTASSKTELETFLDTLSPEARQTYSQCQKLLLDLDIELRQTDSYANTDLTRIIQTFEVIIEKLDQHSQLKSTCKKVAQDLEIILKTKKNRHCWSDIGCCSIS